MWIEKYISRDFLLACLIKILSSIAFFKGMIDQHTWLGILLGSQVVYTTNKTVQKIKRKYKKKKK